MKYLNQLEYRHIPYRTRVKMDVEESKKNTTVASSGCGICSICMMIDLLTDTTLDIEECIKISESCVANHAAGTDMSILAPVIAEKFNLDYKPSYDYAEAVAHLQRGGQIVAHMGIPEGQTLGLFTKGGHYICLVGTDGENFCILDPSYTPEKFTIPERAGRINTDHAPYLYCHKDVVHSETRRNRPFKYHLFARKGGFSAI